MLDRIRRVARASLFVVVTLALLVLITANIRLYTTDSRDYAPDRVGEDVQAQLAFVGQSLRAGAASDMQHLFPEGYFFTHVLYGLAWVESGMRRPPGDPLRLQAEAEGRWALTRLESADGTAPFTMSLSPRFGVFYAGWCTLLRGGILLLVPPEQRNQAELTRYRNDCAEIGAAFAKSRSPFLESYPGQCWPCDSVVAIAALRIQSAVEPGEATPTVDNWLAAASNFTDSATGLYPHRVDIAGHAVEGPRGSSQSIIQRFLPEIDADLAARQYQSFRKNFVGTPLRIPGIREYPLGLDGRGNVDSGPLLCGLSASNSVVSIGAAQLHGDHELATALLSLTEAGGLPYHHAGGKRYLLGQLPVGDAFLVWSKTARPWTRPLPAESLPPVTPPGWRMTLHAVSLVLAALAFLTCWRIRPHPSLPSTRQTCQTPPLPG